MKRAPPSMAAWGIGIAACLLAAGGVEAWIAANPLPDGYQNEYLHTGNAYDLWEALRAADFWHLRYYVSVNYWPPGFYVAPWPLFALLGMSRDALLLTNVAWLALALASVHRLAEGGRGGLWAMVLLFLCPGTWGGLLRYEPNLALTACLGLWLVALRASEGFRRPGWSALAGGALALGLLVDRLGLLPFLPLPLLAALGAGGWRRYRSGRPLPWRGLLFFVGVPAAVAGPWYAQWASEQFAEISQQLAAGEVDSTGALTHSLPPTRLEAWLYYPASLLDGQAGLVLGGAMIVAILVRPRRDLLLTVLGGWLLFALVPKKQVFYTLPLLLPLSAGLGGALARAGAGGTGLGLILAATGILQIGTRLQEAPPGRGTAWARQAPFPSSWVEPRHSLLRPPRPLDLPLEDLAKRLRARPGPVILFSRDPELFEGYLRLLLRPRLPGQEIRSLLEDPRGTYEWFRASRHLLVAEPRTAPDPIRWPRKDRLVEALEQTHYDLAELPPVVDVVVSDAPHWEPTATWTTAPGSRLVLWERERWDHEAP